MSFSPRSEQEVDWINRIQQERFDELVDLFEPPLPKGVPGRLKRIAAAGGIGEGETVLDVGAGTGILAPRIRPFQPGRIIACDLSEKMLAQLKANYPEVETIRADVRDLSLPAAAIDVVLINASYPNIADKAGAFGNLSRLMRPGGRMVVSHPLGRRFVAALKRSAPYPLDDFPTRTEAKRLLTPFGFDIRSLVDEPELYILTAEKQ